MADTSGEDPRPFGVASLMQATEGVHFPVSREKLVLERGERDVEFRHGHREKLRVMLLRCGDCEDFASFEDLLSQIEDLA